ncbi:MAG: AMP-binding protein [Nocardioides sp.]
MQVPLVVTDFLDRAVAVYPDRIAVVDEPDHRDRPQLNSWGSVSYAELAARARRQAANLDRLGLGPGARVAVMSQNSARLLTSFYGVSGWGRILVPINFRLTSAEVSYIVEHSGASVLMLDPELAHLADRVTCENIFILGRDDDQIWGETGREPLSWEPDENATGSINYTSGTTARPKGVQLTHRNNWLNAAVLGWQVGVNDRDVYLHTLPMFHANGWGMPFAVTGMGGTHVVQRQIDGAEILRRISEHGVTLLCAAPAVLNSVLDAAETWSGPIPGDGVTRVVAAGAPPPTRTIERIRSELGWEFIQIYGLTETSPLLTMSRMRSEWDDLSATEQAQNLSRAGAPALGTSIKVDEFGELLVRSNHVMEGYWNNPEASDDALAGGWFHTGDGGTFSDGYATILDRKKDVIISGGENVSSIEVEDALMAHPDVAEAAVIGTPDEKWGELVTALVVLRDGSTVTAEEITAHCRERLAGYKLPRRIEFRDSLVRTATGKLQKFKLREEFWGGKQRQVN